MSSDLVLLKFIVLIVSFKYTIGEEIHYERLNINKHLSEIPSSFEVVGENAKLQFNKYANDIQAMSAAKNLTVVYRIKVKLVKPVKRKNIIKKMYKTIRSKKYNVPLKRQSMKLSNFEVLLRKLAEENSQKTPNYDVQFTTKKPESIFTTKQVKLKYKPIISPVKMNYTKVIKPVRNKIITLTV